MDSGWILFVLRFKITEVKKYKESFKPFCDFHKSTFMNYGSLSHDVNEDTNKCY